MKLGYGFPVQMMISLFTLMLHFTLKGFWRTSSKRPWCAIFTLAIGLRSHRADNPIRRYRVALVVCRCPSFGFEISIPMGYDGSKGFIGKRTQVSFFRNLTPWQLSCRVLEYVAFIRFGSIYNAKTYRGEGIKNGLNFKLQFGIALVPPYQRLADFTV